MVTPDRPPRDPRPIRPGGCSWRDHLRSGRSPRRRRRFGVRPFRRPVWMPRRFFGGDRSRPALPSIVWRLHCPDIGEDRLGVVLARLLCWGRGSFLGGGGRADPAFRRHPGDGCAQFMMPHLTIGDVSAGQRIGPLAGPMLIRRSFRRRATCAAAPRGDFSVGLRPSFVIPAAAHSHPDCRAILILIVAPHRRAPRRGRRYALERDQPRGADLDDPERAIEKRPRT